MGAKVFISHSCKDHESEGPAGLSQEQALVRRRRLAFARKLRGEIVEALETNENLNVFLDVRGGLQAGDVWRDSLHQALRDCAGAVVLLTPESLQSGWVLKEATILSWRVFLGEALRLVLVVLDVSSEELTERGFGALDLDAIQWVKVADAGNAARAGAVAQVSAALSGCVAGAGATRWTDTAERWIAHFADALEKGASGSHRAAYVDAMWRAVGADPGSRDDGGNPFVALATETLAATPDQIVELLYQAAQTRPKPEREALEGQARPLWVDATSASRLPLASQRGQVVAIDAENAETAREYVKRAYCNAPREDQVLIPNAVTDGTDDEILEEIETFIDGYHDIEDQQGMRDSGPIFVILGPGLIRDGVLRGLRDRLPPLSLILVAGPNPTQGLGEWANRVLMLRPGLQPRRERQATRYRNRLRAFVNQSAA